MKEKIRKILTVDRGVVYGDIPGLIADLEPLINQEVERRIAERMDETEASFLERWIRTFNVYSDMSAFCNGYNRMREERNLLLARLSQKSEGGEGKYCVCKGGSKHSINRICQKCKGILPIKH
jgi:hypothetical protein